jgi:hypothetical protein
MFKKININKNVEFIYMNVFLVYIYFSWYVRGYNTVKSTRTGHLKQNHFFNNV